MLSFNDVSFGSHGGAGDVGDNDNKADEDENVRTPSPRRQHHRTVSPVTSDFNLSNEFEKININATAPSSDAQIQPTERQNKEASKICKYCKKDISSASSATTTAIKTFSPETREVRKEREKKLLQYEIIMLQNLALRREEENKKLCARLERKKKKNAKNYDEEKKNGKK
uniref:Uncharacterized protein n=1 Tax=Panagrolaimus sp. PS1159 TaxID=55785 RepID=A0AC35GZF1_9BILA